MTTSQNRRNPRQGIETNHPIFAETIRPARQNRRNPRQGIETQPQPTFLLFIFPVRIDEIPVRGLKQANGSLIKRSRPLVRIDEIPVRGLKLFLLAGVSP